MRDGAHGVGCWGKLDCVGDALYWARGYGNLSEACFGSPHPCPTRRYRLLEEVGPVRSNNKARLLLHIRVLHVHRMLSPPLRLAFPLPAIRCASPPAGRRGAGLMAMHGTAARPHSPSLLTAHLLVV